MGKGWIKLNRQIQEHWIWDDERYDKAHAWIDLLLLADHETKKKLYRGEIILLERGSVNRSFSCLAERWKWSRKAVRHFIDILEKDGMVSTRVSTNRTVITIENYDKYQNVSDEGINESNNEGINRGINRGSNEGNTNKNVKNDKNEKNIYLSSFVTFWENYPKKQDKGQAYKCYKARLNDGWSEEELLTACKNYAAECKKEKRETRYIKNGSTFLSSTTPFTDFLKKGGNDLDRGITGGSESDEERVREQVRRIESGEEPDERPFADMP